MSRVLTTIHPAMIARKMKMNGQDPPKLAISSATRSPKVRSSCAWLSAGCERRACRHGNQLLRDGMIGACDAAMAHLRFLIGQLLNGNECGIGHDRHRGAAAHGK